MQMARALSDLDVRLLHAVYGGGAPRWLTLLMVALTVSCSGWEIAILVPLVASQRTRLLGLLLALSMTATGVASMVLKPAFGRLRPPFAVSGVHSLYGSPTSWSFPSGHAMVSFTIATFLSFLMVDQARHKPTAAAAVIPLLAWALGVSVSRIFLGVHYPSDVVAGALVGGSIGWVGYRYAALELDHRKTAGGASLATRGMFSGAARALDDARGGPGSGRGTKTTVARAVGRAFRAACGSAGSRGSSPT